MIFVNRPEADLAVCKWQLKTYLSRFKFSETANLHHGITKCKRILAQAGANFDHRSRDERPDLLTN